MQLSSLLASHPASTASPRSLPKLLRANSLTMIPGGVTELSYFSPEYLLAEQVSFTTLQRNVTDFHFHGLSSNFTTSQSPFPCEFTLPASTLSNNSNSDDAEENQMTSVIDERKQRRMLSNRESARRSRMRKQQQLNELSSQVIRLRSENHNLIDKLNHASEIQERVLRENARLKEETYDLRQMLNDVQIGSPFAAASVLSELDDVTCNAAYLRAESSSQFVANPIFQL